MAAYDPLTGRYTPSKTTAKAPTSGPVKGFTPTITTPAKPVTVGPVAKQDPFASILARLGQTSANLAKLEEVAKAANAPVKESAADLAGIAKDKAVATEAARVAKVATAGTGFAPAGTLLRYMPGRTPGGRIPIYANGSGGEYPGAEEVNPVIPGSTGTSAESERTIAKDTFANTLALMMGKNEATQPWVQEMYQLASGFYKTGSTIDESLNFALYEAKDKGLAPQFTKRFKGVFALQERLQKGEAISVPTIAEFVKAESDMGDIMREAGLGDLASQEFLGDIIGTGKSVLEVGNIISKTFEAIDTAPKSLKDTLTQYFPGVDRVSIAKALLSGPEGYKALQQKVEAVSVLSAAGSQGVNVDLATAGDIAARGFNYEQALTGFGQVSELKRANVLAEFEGGKYTQQQAQKAVFEQSQQEKDKLEALKLKEVGRFQQSAGLAPSALRGKSAREIL